MSQEITIAVENPVQDPLTLQTQAKGILGERLKALACIASQVTFVLAAPYSGTDQATCENILAGNNDHPVNGVSSCTVGGGSGGRHDWQRRRGLYLDVDAQRRRDCIIGVGRGGDGGRLRAGYWLNRKRRA